MTLAPPSRRRRKDSSPFERIPSQLTTFASLLPWSRRLPRRDDSAGMTSEDPMVPVALTFDEIVRLRAALAELAACEDILDAARRR